MDREPYEKDASLTEKVWKRTCPQVAVVILVTVDEVGEGGADDLGAKGKVDGPLLGSDAAVELVDATATRKRYRRSTSTQAYEPGKHLMSLRHPS